MSHLARSAATVADIPRAAEPAATAIKRKTRVATGKPMIDRYRWYEMVALYAGI